MCGAANQFERERAVDQSDAQQVAANELAERKAANDRHQSCARRTQMSVFVVVLIDADCDELEVEVEVEDAERNNE